MKMAKGSLRPDLPGPACWVQCSSSQPPAFPTELSTMFCSECLQDQASHPTSAIGNKSLFLIATLPFLRHF